MDAYPFRTRRSTADGFSRTVSRLGIGFGLLGAISFGGLAVGSGANPLELPAWFELLKPLGWLACGMAVTLLVVAWADTRRQRQIQRQPDPVRPTARSHAAVAPAIETPREAQARVDVAPVGTATNFAPTQFPHTVILTRRPDELADQNRPDGRPAVPTDQWSEELLRVIEWRRFEMVCARLLAMPGLDVKPRTTAGRHGVDIWLYSKHKPGEAVSVVHCCQWIDAEAVPDVLGGIEQQMKSRGVVRASLATVTALSAPTRQRAEVAGIAILDGAALLSLIRQRSVEQQAQLLSVATEGEYWRPTCHLCGLKMVDKVDSTSGRSRWVCANAPRCRHQLPRRDA